MLAPLARAEYVGSEPAESVYIVQSRRHTCTLIAATMMLRNYAEQTEGDGDATGDSEGGCQSVMLSGALPLLALLAVPAILCKPISDAKKRRNQ